MKIIGPQMPMQMALSTVFFLATMGAALAQGAPQTNLTDSCTEDFQDGVNYFPDRVNVIHARNFSVEYHDSYKVLTVNQPYQGGDPEAYVLLQCGAPAPQLDDDLAGAQIIQVPISTIFITATTESVMIPPLGRVGAITGLSDFSQISSDPVLERIAEGDLVQFDTGSGEIDVEVVIANRPDLFVTQGVDTAQLQQLRAAGIPVVSGAGWLESSALGRAEWLKYMSLFFNEEAQAEQVFAEIDQSYQDAAALVADIPEEEKPLVMSGATYQGIFYAAGGRSYVAESIAKAGGRYIFPDNSDTGSIVFRDLENIVIAGAEADFWINANSDYHTLADLTAEEPRLARLPAAQMGQVWIPDTLNGKNGGSQIFEMGTLRPDLVLRDLIAIFHPGTIPEHKMLFYRSIGLD